MGAFRGCSSGAFLPPGSENPTARPPCSLQEEVARKVKPASCGQSPGELPLEDDWEEGEIQAFDQVNVAAGGAEPEGLRGGEEKNAPCRKTQIRRDPAGKGRRRSKMGSPGNSAPPARRAVKGGSNGGQVTARAKRIPQRKGRRLYQEASPSGRQDASPGRSGNKLPGACPQKAWPVLGRTEICPWDHPRRGPSGLGGVATQKIDPPAVKL